MDKKQMRSLVKCALKKKEILFQGLPSDMLTDKSYRYYSTTDAVMLHTCTFSYRYMVVPGYSPKKSYGVFALTQ